jgi:RNA polymerase sigma factor (sigma-70 family)
MSLTGHADEAVRRNAGQFNTTHWSAVEAAGQRAGPQADAALQELCQVYWYPLYAYVRRNGHSSHDAQDLTQEFFSRLLAKNSLRFAARERGRFRSYLLKSFQHFLVNEWMRGQAEKRGGGQSFISLDNQEAEEIYLQEPASELPAESFYDKRWAVTLLERTVEELGAYYSAAKKRELFERLKPFLLVEASAERYRELAALLGMSEGAVKGATHRLRQRFRDTLRAEVAQTVATESEVDEELRCLMAALTA